MSGIPSASGNKNCASARGGEWLNYCSDTVEFLSTLDDEKLDNTVFRPYVNAQTDITDEHIVRDFPQVGRLEVICMPECVVAAS